MKIVLLSILLASMGFTCLLYGYLNGATGQDKLLIIVGLVLLIIGCFGISLGWPEPPQARCTPPLRSSIL